MNFKRSEKGEREILKLIAGVNCGERINKVFSFRGLLFRMHIAVNSCKVCSVHTEVDIILVPIIPFLGRDLRETAEILTR